MVAGKQEAVRAAELDGEAQGLGQRRDDVHVDRAQVVAGLALEVLRAALEHAQLVVHAAADVGQGTPKVRAHQLHARVPVQQAARDDPREGDGVLEHVPEGARELVPLHMVRGHRARRMQQDGDAQLLGPGI